MRMMLALGVVGLVACATEADLAPRTIEGIEEASQALADLSAQCAFDAGTGQMTLTLNADDIALVARSSSGAVQVNGIACGGATSGLLEQLTVVEGTSGDQTLLLDYSGGMFSPGVAASAGIIVELGGSSADALKLIGSAAADSYVFGTNGIAVNADSFVDIRVSDVEIFVVNGRDGNDTLSGAGNVAAGAAFGASLELYGGDGNDTLRGGTGDDGCHGGGGNDTLLGGAAADGADRFDGGPDVDVADYSARTAALTITLDGIANDGADGEGDEIASDVETIRGGTGDDQLSGGAGAQTLHGGPGDDTLRGGDGDDIAWGDAGDDTFDDQAAANGADVFNGGAGTDTVSYASRTSSVVVTIGPGGDGEAGENDHVGADIENLIGGAGADTLTGSGSGNVIDGGAGDDTLDGGAGNDILDGGAGRNTLRGGAGADLFDQGAAAEGDDAIYGGADVDTVSYANRTSALTVVMNGTTASGEAGEADLVFGDVENLIGGGGDDTLTGNALDNLIVGGAGTDTLASLAGDDVLDGGLGNDLLDCGLGDADIAIDPTATLSSCELF